MGFALSDTLGHMVCFVSQQVKSCSDGHGTCPGIASPYDFQHYASNVVALRITTNRTGWSGIVNLMHIKVVIRLQRDGTLGKMLKASCGRHVSRNKAAIWMQ